MCFIVLFVATIPIPCTHGIKHQQRRDDENMRWNKQRAESNQNSITQHVPESMLRAAGQTPDQQAGKKQLAVLRIVGQPHKQTGRMQTREQRGQQSRPLLTGQPTGRQS